MMKVFIYRTDTYLPAMREQVVRILSGEQDLSIVGDVTSVNGIADCYYDVVLVCAGHGDYAKVHHGLRMAGIPEERLLLDRAVCVPGFSLERYTKLHINTPSIIAMNCWGGLVSHLLGLPFRSPFVNMFLHEDDYIELLSHFQFAMKSDLEFDSIGYNGVIKIHYPIFRIDGAKLFMNHYADFGQAQAKWYERCQKIDFDNLFVTMYTEDPKVLARFQELPFLRKICFVPFETDVPSGCYLKRELDRTPPPWGESVHPWWSIVNDFAKGLVHYYDIYAMLLEGKQVRLF